MSVEPTTRRSSFIAQTMLTILLIGGLLVVLSVGRPSGARAADAARSCDDGDRAYGDAFVAESTAAEWWKIDVTDLAVAGAQYTRCANGASATDDERGVIGNVAVALALATYYERVAENAKLIEKNDASALYRDARRKAVEELATAERFDAIAEGPRYLLTSTERDALNEQSTEDSLLHRRLDSLRFADLATTSPNARPLAKLVIIIPADTPIPTPTPTPIAWSCAQPDRDVAIDGIAVPAEYPEIAREQGAVGVAVIRVVVAGDGTVRSASVIQSSGNASLDQSAFVAATRTRYLPQIAHCVAIYGSYLFRVDFTGR